MEHAISLIKKQIMDISQKETIYFIFYVSRQRINNIIASACSCICITLSFVYNGGSVSLYYEVYNKVGGTMTTEWENYQLSEFDYSV